MATDFEFVESVADQIDDVCGLSYRKMFGEYALYSNAEAQEEIATAELMPSTKRGFRRVSLFSEDLF